MRLARFYKYHGINIKTCYADFDKHHIGVVTESQVNISVVTLLNVHHTVNNCMSIFCRGGHIIKKYQLCFVHTTCNFDIIRWNSEFYTL